MRALVLNNTATSDMSMPKISVIVPVYNVEPYLRKCIDSILNQSFTDFELILVDDGSTDRSGAICDEYVQMDARVRVFHTPNQGVSAARNWGLDQALGEWITFVDSDDWVEERYLSCFFQTELGPKAIAYQNIIYDYTAYRRENKLAFSYDDVSFDASGIIHAISRYRVLSDCFIAAKMFNKEVIRQYGIRFCEDISLAEDMIFVRHYFYYVEEVHLHSLAAYHYMQRPSMCLSWRHHFSGEQILIFSELRKTIVFLLGKFPINDTSYLKQLYTLHGLMYLVGACREVNKKNYKSVFAYTRLHKGLFEKYYTSASLGSRMFQKALFSGLLPDGLLFFLVRCDRIVESSCRNIIKFFRGSVPPIER